jgi:hypothetical protein
MNGVFVFLINGNLETFYDFNDIPKNFDHVIKFLPDIPDPPHTGDQHREIETWNDRLQALIEKERGNTN